MKALPLVAHPVIPWTQIVPIGKDEKAFFVQLGARIASLRKDQGITQVQMAELPKAQQRFVMQMIDTVLAQQGR